MVDTVGQCIYPPGHFSNKALSEILAVATNTCRVAFPNRLPNKIHKATDHEYLSRFLDIKKGYYDGIFAFNSSRDGDK